MLSLQKPEDILRQNITLYCDKHRKRVYWDKSVIVTYSDLAFFFKVPNSVLMIGEVSLVCYCIMFQVCFSVR